MFATDDATGKQQAAWLVKEQLRTLLVIGSLADAAAAKDRLQALVELNPQPAALPTVFRWWKEIEVLIVTSATTAKVEANNTAIKHIKGQAGDHRRRQFQNAYPVAHCHRNSGMSILMAERSLGTVKSQFSSGANGLPGSPC